MKLTAEQFDTLSAYKDKLSDHDDIFTVPLRQFDQKELHAKDLALPPTLVTAASFGLVLNGCRSIDTVKGVNQVVIGRTGDLLDGFLARVLDMSSDAGALADTAADKLGMLAIATAAWRHDAIPKPVLGTIIAKQTASVALTAATTLRHPDASFRPTRAGKYAMLADNAAFIGYLYANALENEYPERNLHQGAQLLGRTAFAAGSVLSVPATIQYASRALS